MSNKIMLLATVILVLVLSSACSPSAPVQLTDENNAGQAEVKVGEEFVIVLSGNPSTGFTWETKDLDTTMFELVGEPEFLSDNPGLVGSGGKLTLTFKALQAGTATLTLGYQHPWETDVEPIETFSVTLTAK